MSECKKWEIYEKEKAKLRMQPLTDKEYEKAIRELADRLGI